MADIQTVGVIGAGVMGVGVGQALAQAGYDVVLVDTTDQVLAAAERAVATGLRMYGMLTGRPVAAADRAAAAARIRYTTDVADLAGTDFVVENVTEDWEIKRGVYRSLHGVLPEHCHIAANTSVIPITGIGQVAPDPTRVLGMHFMNPVPLKSTVEIIRGHHTSDATIDAAHALLARMDMRGIVVSDSPGFVSNRVLMLTVNEAVFLVAERVAGPAEIDQLFKKCFDHRMGPLETADLIGLDTILQSIDGLHRAFADSKYRPCPLLRQMVDAGLLGRKSGQGFYSYASTTATTDKGAIHG